MMLPRKAIVSDAVPMGQTAVQAVHTYKLTIMKQSLQQNIDNMQTIEASGDAAALVQNGTVGSMRQ